MKIGEEQWMAYVDGELDAAGIARVEAAMRDDPQLVAQVAAQRRLRARLQQEWAPVLQEPVPASLVATLRAPGRGGRAPVWFAAAASLLVGILAASWWQAWTRQPVRIAEEGMFARGILDDALARRLTGDGASGGVEVGLSFRSREGAYCRSFVLEKQVLAGLACHRTDGWQVVALGAAHARGSGLRQAGSSLPPAVLAEIDARLGGDPLDAEGERRARASAWR